MSHRPIVKLLRLVAVGFVMTALTFGLSSAPAEASQKTRVKALIAKIVKSSNPKKTYSKLSKKDRALVRKEVKSGKVSVRIVASVNTTSVPETAPNAPSEGSCWYKTLVASYKGGVSQQVMFTTTNTTQVCSDGGVVTGVTVPEAVQDEETLGWTAEGVTSDELDVNWEGRGVARGRFDFGGGGWALYSRQLCAQLRLNADRVHYSYSAQCSLGA